jgi:dTDP-4-dehydrorhamnose 3,5-epimerase
MKFTSIPLVGAYLIEVEPTFDDRGFFARSWSSAEFGERGLNRNVAQCSISFNTKKGTLRGLHYQEQPHAETKLVRCSSGAIFDVIVDLRPASANYCKWFGIELTAANRRMLYVPEGFAHGFQTLTNDTEVFYQISEEYRSESSKGVRWDDPLLGIVWPLPVSVLSDRDRSFPNYIP